MSRSPGPGAVRAWFAACGWTPFLFQREAWRAYLAGESGLIHAATGTGKTLAAWMGPLLEWLAEQPEPVAARKGSAPPLRVLWITPLRALAADTEAALRAPLEDLGIPWTLERRTADTGAAARARQRKRLPTALVTTPESLSLLLARSDAPEAVPRAALRGGGRMARAAGEQARSADGAGAGAAARLAARAAHLGRVRHPGQSG